MAYSKRNYAYRVEDKMTQWIVYRALEHYKHTNPLNMDPIEQHLLQSEIDKLSKLFDARINANGRTASETPPIR
jgi:hypothetical protein